jgi:hypothetical protein
MTAERSIAYQAAVKTIGDLRAAKFTPAEADTLTVAADDLLFGALPADQDPSYADACALLDRLQDAGRLIDETAEKIKAQLAAIAAPALVAA